MLKKVNKNSNPLTTGSGSLFNCRMSAIFCSLLLLSVTLITFPSFAEAPDSLTIYESLYEPTDINDTLIRKTPSIQGLIPTSGLDEDKVYADTDTVKNWWKLLKKGKLNLSDTTVEYPKFLGFCVKVYNWADKTFNSYDTTYVAGTGRRWKARLVSDNWVDSYYLNLSKKMPMRMMSDFYCNAGAYIQYMAVSLGYSIDMSNIIGHKPSNHKKLELSFNCARFNIEGHYWESTGGTFIRTFGDFNDGKLIKEHFPGVIFRTIGVNGYYFFNNRKFSMGAAYNFSKIQKKSAGSAIIGLNFNNLDITMDMNDLPETLKPYLNISPNSYRFHYNSYALMGGYSYNCVLNRHFLFNISAFPGIGFTHAYEDSVESGAKLFSLIMKGQTSLTYNLNDFFICAIGKIDGNWYRSPNFSFFSSVENLQVSIGFRF